MSTQIQVQKPEQNRQGIYLKCPHSCCNGRIWRYKGTMSIYAVCPNCRRAVPIDRNRVTVEEFESLKNSSSLTSNLQSESQTTPIIGVG